MNAQLLKPLVFRPQLVFFSAQKLFSWMHWWCAFFQPVHILICLCLHGHVGYHRGVFTGWKKKSNACKSGFFYALCAWGITGLFSSFRPPGLFCTLIGVCWFWSHLGILYQYFRKGPRRFLYSAPELDVNADAKYKEQIHKQNKYILIDKMIELSNVKIMNPKKKNDKHHFFVTRLPVTSWCLPVLSLWPPVFSVFIQPCVPSDILAFIQPCDHCVPYSLCTSVLQFPFIIFVFQPTSHHQHLFTQSVFPQCHCMFICTPTSLDCVSYFHVVPSSQCCKGLVNSLCASSVLCVLLLPVF